VAVPRLRRPDLDGRDEGRVLSSVGHFGDGEINISSLTMRGDRVSETSEVETLDELEVPANSG